MEDRSAALLAIDVQIGLVELVAPEVHSSVLSKVKTLLTKARATGIAVIFIQHDGPKGHPLEAHTKGWGIHPSLKPVGGDPIVRKRDSLPTSSLLGE
jgi:nicotinamidase-related amidase